MSQMFNVFDSEQTACDAASYDFDKHIEMRGDRNGYDQETTSWAKPLQRVTDGKWVYPVCSASDGVYTVEMYNTGGTWFPAEEEDF